MSVSAHTPAGVASIPAATPSVSINSNNVQNLRILATCFTGVRFDADGDEWGADETGAWTINRGKWLDKGKAEDVWVSRSVSGITLDWQDAGTGRYQLSSDRLFGAQRTTQGTDSGTVTFSMWDAATGGNLLQSQTITLSAEYDGF